MHRGVSLCMIAVWALTASCVQTVFAAESQVVELSLPPPAQNDHEQAKSNLSGKSIYSSEKELDQARNRLRDELLQSRAADNQAWASVNSERLDRELADKKTLTRQSYARSGRNQVVQRSLENTRVSTSDAKILSEWARDQKIDPTQVPSVDDETRKKMLDQYRKQYPSSEAAKAMQDWISTGSVSEERKEARQFLKDKRTQKKN